MTHASSKAAEIVVPKKSLTPCILDDDPAQLELLSAVIVEMGYAPIPTHDPEEALRLVNDGRCRVVLVAARMPEMDGYEFLDRALRSDPGVHVILMAREYTLESALEAIRRGASDFLPKPVDRAHLRKTLDDVAALYDQRRRVRELEQQLLKDLEFHGIVGKSPVMMEVFDFARKVARHYSNVLLVGPTGTGKRAGGESDPPDQPGWIAEAGGMQLLGHDGFFAGKPAFWTRARIVHGGNGDAAGIVRVCQWRHRVSG